MKSFNKDFLKFLKFFLRI